MAGAVLNAIGFVGYGWLSLHYGPAVSSWQMVTPLAVTGFGFGLVVAPMVDAILTGVPVRDAGSASGLLSTTQQVGMALGIAPVGILFFGQLEGDAGRGVDEVAPAVQEQLAAAGVPATGQQAILAGFRQCVRDRSAATDPTEIPASCRPAPGAESALLARAGVQANAHNFARTFGTTLWYAAGVLVVVLLGLFGLPRRVQARDLDAELSPGDYAGQVVPASGTVRSIR